MALILREAEADGASAERCADRLAALFREPGRRRRSTATRWSRAAPGDLRWLRAAGLLEAGDGEWRLSARGREALAAHPQGMDLADLAAAIPEFAAHLHARGRGGAPVGRGAARARRPMIEGFAARHAGAAFTDNPYDFATADHQLWEKGWCEALDEEAGPSASPPGDSRRDAT